MNKEGKFGKLSSTSEKHGSPRKIGNLPYLHYSIGILGFLIAASSVAQCASSYRASRIHGGYAAVAAIRLVPKGIPPRLMDELRFAYGAWNDRRCNTVIDVGAGLREFPHLRESAVDAGRTVTVRFHKGMNPANNHSCGHLSGNVINLYEEGRRENGYPMKCDTSAVFRDTVTHELGHLLGLEDQYGSDCFGHAMSQAVFDPVDRYVDRSLRSVECAMVAAINDTFLPDVRDGSAPETLRTAVVNHLVGETGKAGAGGGVPAAEGP
jgi:hypothetical protein